MRVYFAIKLTASGWQFRSKHFMERYTNLANELSLARLQAIQHAIIFLHTAALSTWVTRYIGLTSVLFFDQK